MNPAKLAGPDWTVHGVYMEYGGTSVPMIGGQRNHASCYYLHHGGLALLVFRAVSATLGHGQYLLLPMLLRSTLTQKRLGPQDHVFLCTRYVRPISGCNWCTFCVGLIDVASTPYSVVSKCWRRPGNQAIFLPLVNQAISQAPSCFEAWRPPKDTT